MTQDSSRSMAKHDDRQKNAEAGSVATSAANHHIGPTLESEGIFTDVLGDALPVGETGLRQPDETVIDAPDVRSFDQDRTYQRATSEEDRGREAGGDAVAPPTTLDADDEANAPVGAFGDQPERLKTRLAGDTSSDPHTDVGPDNATTAHAAVPE